MIVHVSRARMLLFEWTAVAAWGPPVRGNVFPWSKMYAYCKYSLGSLSSFCPRLSAYKESSLGHSPQLSEFAPSMLRLHALMLFLLVFTFQQQDHPWRLSSGGLVVHGESTGATYCCKAGFYHLEDAATYSWVGGCDSNSFPSWPCYEEACSSGVFARTLRARRRRLIRSLSRQI